MRPVTMEEIESLAIGAWILGTGGGGSPYLALLNMYETASLVHEGGFISYGANPDDNFRRAASYVDRIFKGATPNSLPVERPIRYYLAINLKTARALGLVIPPTVLVRADEVIQ